MRDTLFRDRAKAHLHCTVASCWKPRAWLSTIRVTHRLLRVTHACWREQYDMQQRNINPSLILVENFKCFSDSASHCVPDASRKLTRYGPRREPVGPSPAALLRENLNPICDTRFTSLESNRGYDSSITHTNTHTLSLSWTRRFDAQLRDASVENQNRAITHSRMRDNQYRTPPHRVRQLRNTLSFTYMPTTDIA
jgi:hypothetical protein